MSFHYSQRPAVNSQAKTLRDSSKQENHGWHPAAPSSAHLDRYRAEQAPTAAATPLEKRRKLMEAWACYCMRTENVPRLKPFVPSH